MPTRNDVITLAFQRLGMGVSGDAVEANEAAIAGTILESIYQELGEIAPPTWGLGDLPHEALLPMADYLASELAPVFAMSPPRRPGVAKLRVLALINPDDRRPTQQSPEDTGEAEYF